MNWHAKKCFEARRHATAAGINNHSSSRVGAWHVLSRGVHRLLLLNRSAAPPSRRGGCVHRRQLYRQATERHASGAKGTTEPEERRGPLLYIQDHHRSLHSSSLFAKSSGAWEEEPLLIRVTSESARLPNTPLEVGGAEGLVLQTGTEGEDGGQLV